MVNIRVGFGYDVHPLGEGRELWLGGIKLQFDKGCVGHSDADVLLHAICDALLGAANLGDIGFHFPNTDAKYKNADASRAHDRTRTGSWIVRAWQVSVWKSSSAAASDQFNTPGWAAHAASNLPTNPAKLKFSIFLFSSGCVPAASKSAMASAMTCRFTTL